MEPCQHIYLEISVVIYVDARTARANSHYIKENGRSNLVNWGQRMRCYYRRRLATGRWGGAKWGNTSFWEKEEKGRKEKAEGIYLQKLFYYYSEKSWKCPILAEHTKRRKKEQVIFESIHCKHIYTVYVKIGGRKPSEGKGRPKSYSFLWYFTISLPPVGVFPPFHVGIWWIGTSNGGKKQEKFNLFLCLHELDSCIFDELCQVYFHLYEWSL